MCATYSHFSNLTHKRAAAYVLSWERTQGNVNESTEFGWSAVWWNEGLFMAGNPFEGPGAHLDLALFAHGPCGQVCILPWLVWPSTCRWAEAEWHRTRVTMRHSPSHPQGAHLRCEHSLMGSVASVLCFCRWDSDHTNADIKKGLLHYKHPQPIPLF